MEAQFLHTLSAYLKRKWISLVL